jgi:hypothetical protein
MMEYWNNGMMGHEIITNFQAPRSNVISLPTCRQEFPMIKTDDFILI